MIQLLVENKEVQQPGRYHMPFSSAHRHRHIPHSPQPCLSAYLLSSEHLSKEWERMPVEPPSSSNNWLKLPSEKASDVGEGLWT